MRVEKYFLCIILATSSLSAVKYDPFYLFNQRVDKGLYLLTNNDCTVFYYHQKLDDSISILIEKARAENSFIDIKKDTIKEIIEITWPPAWETKSLYLKTELKNVMKLSETKITFDWVVVNSKDIKFRFFGFQMSIIGQKKGPLWLTIGQRRYVKKLIKDNRVDILKINLSALNPKMPYREFIPPKETILVSNDIN